MTLIFPNATLTSGIGSGGGGGGTTYTGSAPISVSGSTISLLYDNQLLQLNSSNQLTVNLDEIGSEISDLSSRVTTAENNITSLQTDIGDISTLLDTINGESV